MDLGGECHIAELPFSAPSIGVCDMGVFIPAESHLVTWCLPLLHCKVAMSPLINNK